MVTDLRDTTGAHWQSVVWRSLVRSGDFQTVYRGGAKKVGRFVVVYLLSPPSEASRIVAPDLAMSVVASKKVGNAVARNRAKRRLREAYRQGALGNAKLDRLEQSQAIGRIKDVWEQFRDRSRVELAANMSVYRGAAGRSNQAAVVTAAQKTDTFVGLWVVLVARHQILIASSRQVVEELNALLGAEPQSY